MNKFQHLLTTEPYLLLDGAMGTLLFSVGLSAGDPPEEWNVLYPEKIQATHRAYAEAGSNLILTNSFGGTRYRLKLHKLQDRAYEFNKAAAENARAVADSMSHPVVVAGSIGPSGELLHPMGNMRYAEAVDAFAEQARGLIDGGADVLWIETMSDIDEVRAAYDGARSVSNEIPICATMSFDTNARTMMGVTGKQMMAELADLDFAALGANCGNNLADTEAVVAEMRSANSDIPLIAKANAGVPRWIDGNEVYDGSPEVMAAYAHRMRELGVQLIGGCCGSTPPHIQMMRCVLSGELPVPDVTVKVRESVPGIVDNRPKRRRRRRKQ